ncbi:hypothetical protein [Fontivita pretiosa]|uniref:hypothetical protein n=1 Tax=Fontivita pretiosa TaxID=2989684 RepID=UPI003D16C48B
MEWAIEQAWRNAMSRPGVHLFDGPMCRMESLDPFPGQMRIAVSKTSYKPFLGTNLSNSHLAERYGQSALANAIGLSCLLLSGDGYALLGRRNDAVAYYPGRVHPFSGALEPADEIDVFAEIRRELREELSLRESDIRDLVCTGIAEDRSLLQPEMIFAAQTGLDRRTLEAQLDPQEHRGLWSVARSAQAFDAALGSGERFTPVGVAALLLWGRIAFGQDWFARHQQRIRG